MSSAPRRAPCGAHDTGAPFRAPARTCDAHRVHRRQPLDDGGADLLEVDLWLIGDDRSLLDEAVFAGQAAMRVNDLTSIEGLRSGRLQPVLLDWQGVSAPPLTLLVRKSLVRQPRVRAFVRHLQTAVDAIGRDRLPRGLPPVPVPERPDWFRRRVG